MEKVAGSSQFGTPNFNMGTVKTEPRATPSPYGGSLSPYNPYETSPVYPTNILSPQTQATWNSPASVEPLPSMGMWNIPSASEMTNPVQIDVQNLDSGEIVRQIAMVDSQHSLPNLELSFSDIAPTTTDQNMTDSITKLVNCRIDEIYPNN